MGVSLIIRQTPGLVAAAPPPALAYDASAIVAGVNEELSVNLGIGAGLMNRIVLAHVAIGDPSDIGSTIVSVTYDGSAMTLIPGSAQFVGLCNSAWYYLVNPPTGSKVCDVTVSDPVSIVLSVISYANVNQSTPLGAVVLGTGTSTNPHLSLDIAAGNAAVFGVFADLTANGTTPSASGNVNVRRSSPAGVAPSIVRGTIGDDLVDTGAPFALGITQSASRPWGMAACELKKA